MSRKINSIFLKARKEEDNIHLINYTNIIITDDDLDGCAAAAGVIANTNLDHINFRIYYSHIASLSDHIFEELKKDIPFSEYIDTIYILDKKFFSNKNKVREIINEYNPKKIIWIDHHPTNIKDFLLLRDECDHKLEMFPDLNCRIPMEFDVHNVLYPYKGTPDKELRRFTFNIFENIFGRSKEKDKDYFKPTMVIGYFDSFGYSESSYKSDKTLKERDYGVKRSAAFLVNEYFKMNSYIKMRSRYNPIYENLRSIMNVYTNHSSILYAVLFTDNIKYNEIIDRFFENVSDWDTFEWKKYNHDSVERKFSNYLMALMNNLTYEGNFKRFLNHLSLNHSELIPHDEIYELGKECYDKYIENIEKEILTQLFYKPKIYNIINLSEENNPKHKLIFLKNVEWDNISMVADTIFGRFNYVDLIIFFNDQFNTFSFRSRTTENENNDFYCNKLARSLHPQGGGHTHAAGCNIDEDININVNVVNIEKTLTRSSQIGAIVETLNNLERFNKTYKIEESMVSM